MKMRKCRNVKIKQQFSNFQIFKFSNYKDMKLSDVLIRPVLSEKVNRQTEKQNRYTFVVDRKANKYGRT
ncbi:MAG: 50S ribosomal protein L23 [Chitinophagaceae bacterium]